MRDAPASCSLRLFQYGFSKPQVQNRERRSARDCDGQVVDDVSPLTKQELETTKFFLSLDFSVGPSIFGRTHQKDWISSMSSPGTRTGLSKWGQDECQLGMGRVADVNRPKTSTDSLWNMSRNSSLKEARTTSATYEEYKFVYHLAERCPIVIEPPPRFIRWSHRRNFATIREITAQNVERHEILGSGSYYPRIPAQGWFALNVGRLEKGRVQPDGGVTGPVGPRPTCITSRGSVPENPPRCIYKPDFSHKDSNHCAKEEPRLGFTLRYDQSTRVYLHIDLSNHSRLASCRAIPYTSHDDQPRRFLIC